MSTKVCIGANTHELLQAGGHVWCFLNWALALKALGCEVVWLEQVSASAPKQQVVNAISSLKRVLAPYGLDSQLCFCSSDHEPLPPNTTNACLDIAEILDADLLLNIGGKIGACTVVRFHRSAFIDIDPGLTQIWISESKRPIAPHDIYFTIGETVGTPRAKFPDCGVRWHYTPVAIYLPKWESSCAEQDAPYTTVTSWWGWWEEFQGETFNNEKRTSFLDYLQLPRHSPARLELALALWEYYDHEDVRLLESNGWQVKHAFDIGHTPHAYHRYLQRSRGEFSCAKPSCMRLENAWISDRSLCYMAMGKPAIVQYTGPSLFLPDARGLFRFRSLEEAVHALELAEADYDFHAQQARAFVEEHCNGTRVVKNVLERALV